MRSLTRIAGGLVLLALAVAPTTAYAAVTGSIEGTVTDQATGKKLAGVTVTVTSPALQGEQTEFTDADGRYNITELPPGEYLVRFYFSTINVERPGVFVQSDKTLSVNVAIPTQRAEVKTYRITEKAPTVDVGNTQQQTAVTSEMVKNTPVKGRTYDAVLTLAPGAAADPVGFSFNGATGPENNFLIDGVNTTDPAVGLLGTRLTLEFIGETEIITGGYNAEYGRATGGVVNVITKAGSNNFHGDVWFYVTPYQLQPNLIARSGEAIAYRANQKFGFDVGFDIGGPIVKDKLWFFAGFAPVFETYQADRFLRTRVANNLPGTQMTGTYNGDLDPATTCPKGLDRAFCNTMGILAPGYTTVMLDDSYRKHYETERRLYNWIAKLNFQPNPNNSLSVEYIGSPATTSGLVNGQIGGSATSAINIGTPIFNNADSVRSGSRFSNVHDVNMHYTSKLADRRLQLDFLAGWHYDDETFHPDAAGQALSILYARTLPLGDLETRADGTAITPCQTQMTHGVSFNPCPVLNYRGGGWGLVGHTTVQRVSAAASATYFARLGGTHALKLGFDFEDNIYFNNRNYTSGAFLRERSSGAVEIYREFGSKVLANGPNGMGMPLPDTGFSATTLTYNYGAYLRDSWNVGFIPGLTINAGVRYEAQQAKDTNGDIAIGIYDNWAPRVGAIYDFTRKGRSKIFASYGWFYESIPLDINDRQFSGEGLIASVPPGGMGCTADPTTHVVNLANCGPTRSVTNGQINGGTFGLVSPALKGQYSEEVIAGVQYDVGLDLVLGASYIHRDLGRIIEDASPDGGNNYLIMNPGDAIDSGAVKDLQSQITKLEGQIANTADPTQKQALTDKLNLTQQRLGLYQNQNNGFPKAVRNYDALVITANKRLSHNFQILASYTYSRTLGNYPGTFQASNGQLDPNISTQYDLRELLFNRQGPLPNDRPHNVKVLGSYLIPFGSNTVILGLQFNGVSGTPIEVLGGHPTYGRQETFILPRGSGGRTPFLTTFDFHVSYRRQLSKMFGFEAYADLFNLFNQQETTYVDQEYTTSSVNPIQNGKVTDLVNLKQTNGTQPLLNPNYGNTIALQAPLSMRFGLRLSF